MPTSLADRLEKARLAKGCTQADISRAAKVSRATVSDWFSGVILEMKIRQLFLVSNYLSVRPEWLAFDDGPMKADRLATVERELLSLFRKMDDDQQKAVMGVAKLGRMISHAVEPDIPPAPPPKTPAGRK